MCLLAGELFRRTDGRFVFRPGYGGLPKRDVYGYFVLRPIFISLFRKQVRSTEKSISESVT